MFEQTVTEANTEQTERRLKERIAELETALVQSCNTARLYGYRDSAPMIDVMRVRRSINC